MEEVSPAYGAEMWHELYVMVGGAAGALAGLLFVAVSINLDRIINQKYLPRRAAETLTIMVGLLVLAVLVLIPQSVLALGSETVVLGLLIILIMIGRLRVPPTAGQSVLLHYVCPP